MHADTVAGSGGARLTRILAPEASPISTSLETVLEIEAKISCALYADMRVARELRARIAEYERIRVSLHALAAELEVRLPRRASRRKAAA